MAFSEKAPEIIVKIGGRDVSRNYQVVSISLSAGGRSMDSAIIRNLYDTILGGPSGPFRATEIQDARILSSTSLDETLVEILAGRTGSKVFGGDVTSGFELLFWGQISGRRYDIGRSEILEVAAAPFLFGDPSRGMWEANPVSGGNSLLIGDIVFNPIVDGVVRGNMTVPFGATPGNHNVFLDPKRVHTANARRYAVQGQSRFERRGSTGFLDTDQMWTLREAVYYLCWSLNPKEKFYRNPSRAELERSIPADNDSLLRDLRIKLGTYLPHALDTLLNSFAVTWRVKYSYSGLRELVFFERGNGAKKTLKLQKSQGDQNQPANEPLDPKATNSSDIQLGVGLHSLINEVRIYGSRYYVESTFELVRAWPTTSDTGEDLDTVGGSGDEDDPLTVGSDDWNAHPEYHRVWRDWVLNEAGDYGGRPEIGDPYDVTQLLEPARLRRDFPQVPRRRKFLPCVTLDKDRMPLGRNGYVVQISTDGGETWQDVDSIEDFGGFEVLEDECGISFIGPYPPIELIDAGDDARVRITCAVELDYRTVGESESLRGRPLGRFDSGLSFQGIASAEYIDGDGKFQTRYVHKDSIYKDAELETLSVDDGQRIDRDIQYLRRAWNMADVSGTVVIPTLRIKDYQIGDVIEKIEGREIDMQCGVPLLNLLPDADNPARYPQIVGITYDIQRQRQVLALETFRDPKYIL